MAAKRRGRNVQELYNATEIIGVPKEPSQAEKGLGKSSMRQKDRMRTESGTCNVCSAPCSSCMHLKLACMGSKGDEFSDETCRITASSQYSNNDDGDGIVPFKSRTRDSLLHTTSEASNLLSVSSSHDSLSEYAESKANIRASDADASAESQMLPKLSSSRAVAEDHFSPKPLCLSDQKTLSKKHGDSKSQEGHDDTVSCVSRASDARKVVHYPKKNLDMNNLLCSSDLEVEASGKALFSHNAGSLETPSNDVDAGSSSPKVQTKCLSLNANGKCFNEHPSLHDPGKPFECPVEQVNLSLSKEAASNIDCGSNLAAHENVDNHANGKSTINAESSKIACKIYSKLELDAGRDIGDQLDEGFKGSEQVGLEEKLNGLDELAETQEPPLQSASIDDSDDSEILEHDVKVCDICGDAGREDLLAICSRCTDGAEHTYCMREMLQKVPEGDWLCEECKLAEESGNQKQDAEEKRMNSTQSSGKRQAGTIELVSVPKRQAIESNLGSPKSCSPSRIAAVSRDTSFKSLDKGKVKIAHQTSFGNRFSIDIRETSHPSLNGGHVQTPKGTLLKSNSFNTVNSQPKVKLVNEFPQKHKGTRESSLDMKGRPARMMSKSKSMSFKSVNSGRPITIESKVKMVSSKLSHIQDARGLKQVKDQNAVDRKNLLRLDRPFGSSMPNSAVVSTPKVDQRITPRGESAIASSTSMNRELKSTQSDGKLGTLSRSASSVGRKSADIPATSVRVSSTPGSSSASVEQKSNQISPKDEPSSSSWNTERMYNNTNENLQDGLPQSRESSTQGEKVRESSVNHLRSAGTTGLKIVTCQKCKEVGHATENCTVVSPMTYGTNVPASRTAREGMSKDSKLKTAIEAAMLKRPGIYRKKKESDQSDGVPLLNVDASSEIQDQFSVLNKMNEGTLEGQVNLGVSSSEFCKSANINNVKQLNEHSTDTVCPSKVGQLDSTAAYLGKPAHASVEQSVLVKMSAIPEHEYIWQGAFEVHRSEKFIDFYGGIQAHLSTCASPKVHDMVNKFPQNINLDEVPRLSTWPRQFNISGAKEENIALYFFAKDFESYENYKGLLDNMIKKDLALKGSFDGVEFFIFPSTQLPENSQRWNMLYFLWGVFRGKRSDSNSFKKLVIPSLNVVPRDKDIHAAVLSSLENLRPSECNVKETSACDSSFDVPLTSNAPEKPCVPLNGISDNKVFNSQMIQEKQDGKHDSQSMPTPWCPEVKRSSSSMEEVGLPECSMDVEFKSCAEVTGTNSSSDVEIQMHEGTSCFGEGMTSLKIFGVGSQDSGGRMTFGEEKIVDRTYCDINNAKVERELNEDNVNVDVEASSEKSPRKRPYIDLSETAPLTSRSMVQKALWNKADNNKLVDGESTRKKLKTGFRGLYGGSGSRDGNSLSGSFTSQTCDLGSSSSIEEKSYDKASVEKAILEELGTSERYFFPLDSHHVKDIWFPGNSMPWNSSNDEDKVHDVTPNLELALGAETKSPNKGILPFFGLVEKNDNQNKPSDKVLSKEEDDGVSASLSLSLSFPFPDKEQTVKPVPKTEQLVPERRHVNTSLLLFGDLSDT